MINLHVVKYKKIFIYLFKLCVGKVFAIIVELGNVEGVSYIYCVALQKG